MHRNCHNIYEHQWYLQRRSDSAESKSHKVLSFYDKCLKREYICISESWHSEDKLAQEPLDSPWLRLCCQSQVSATYRDLNAVTSSLFDLQLHPPLKVVGKWNNLLQKKNCVFSLYVTHIEMPASVTSVYFEILKWFIWTVATLSGWIHSVLCDQLANMLMGVIWVTHNYLDGKLPHLCTLNEEIYYSKQMGTWVACCVTQMKRLHRFILVFLKLYCHS